MKKPFSSYNGGKAGNGVYQNIINHIPQCDIFIEPMAGNASITYKMKLPALTVLNDIDKCIIDMHDVTGAGTKIVKHNLDYTEIIALYDNPLLKVVFYLDPPYKFSTRKSKRNIYKNEWTDQQHIDFLNRSLNIKSNCMISHYPCELYDTMLAGWQTFDFVSMTRNGLRTERIYMNYAKPLILQDFQFVGADYRERQRIKRKIARHLQRLEDMPADERTAILSSITAKYNATAERLIRKIDSISSPIEKQPKNQINLLDLIDEVKSEKVINQSERKSINKIQKHGTKALDDFLEYGILDTED